MIDHWRAQGRQKNTMVLYCNVTSHRITQHNGQNSTVNLEIITWQPTRHSEQPFCNQPLDLQSHVTSPLQHPSMTPRLSLSSHFSPAKGFTFLLSHRQHLRLYSSSPAKTKGSASPGHFVAWGLAETSPAEPNLNNLLDRPSV